MSGDPAIYGIDPDVRAAKMVEMAATGMPLKIIGCDFGISAERVRQIIKPFGASAAARRKIRTDASRLRRSFLAGRLMMLAVAHVSQKTAARTIGVTANQVAWISKEHRIRWLAHRRPAGAFASCHAASNELDGSSNLVSQRINKLGWSIERATSQPVNVQRALTPEEIALFGTMPDRELASRLNRWPEVISVARRRLGIPAFKKPSRKPARKKDNR